MKESFLLYKSFYEPIKDFTDAQLGQLFRVIFEWQINPENPVGNLEPNVKMAFEFFKNQFRLDNQKYENIVERNRANGQKGGRPRNPNPENPVGSEKPKKADNENDNEKENENENYNNYAGKPADDKKKE